MPRALLDTDMLSEILKGKDAAVVAKAQQYRASSGVFTVSTITIMEIVKGLHKSNQARRLQTFLDAIASEEILSFDRASAEIAGRIYGDLERRGLTIGRADPMIAGIAVQHDIVLVSGNVEHYARIQSLGYPLRIETWRA